MTLIHFKNHIDKNLSFLYQSKILIAISGGIDSMVLTHLCHELKLNIALVHCNFNLRGKESDGDETFILKLGEDLNLEVFVQTFHTQKYAQEHKCSIQMAARELRYEWFDNLSEQLGYDYILTAHHADDNLETFLINLTRGTGLDGLTGIPEVNGKFVRPLLPFSRQAIERYTKANNIEWREDSGNRSVKYLRNKLRHELVPILKEVNPSLLQSFQNTLKNLKATADIVEDCTNDFLNRAMETKSNTHQTFKVSEFKKLNNPKAYLFEVFKTYGFTEWNDVAGLLDAESGKQVFSTTHRLIKNRSHLLLTDRFTEEITEIVISEKQEQVNTPFGILCFDEADALTHTALNTIFVDKKMLQFPLKLRKKKTGDVFYPLGMVGKKKLSKYFKDEKMSLLDKENTWVLCSNEDIVWVINKRADNRFKVTEKTKHILKIQFK